MYSRALAWACLIAPLQLAGAERETPQELQLKPANCVALHKGRTCYATVKIAWRTSTKGHYCLQNHSENKNLICWHQQHAGQGTFEFAAAEQQHFKLIDMDNNKVIAQQSISLSWLYNKSNKRRRWRLF